MRFPNYADLDKVQRDIFSKAPNDGCLLVTGAPGTGKTVIAMHRAMKLASISRRVISVIMFNKVLSRYTGSIDGIDNKIEIIHMHGWIKHWYKHAFGKAYPTLGKAWAIDWESITREIRACDSATLKKLSFSLIIDEGQDFPRSMYKALTTVVRRTKDELDQDCQANLTVFADENQTITNENISLSDLMVSLNAEVSNQRLWRLDKNYRNTKQCATFTRHFQTAGSTSVKLPDRNGAKPVIRLLSDSKKGIEQITSYATSRIKEIGVIVFGSNTRLIKLHKDLKLEVDKQGLNCRVQAYATNKNAGLNNPLDLHFNSPPSITVVNMKSSKGLEFDSVFLYNTDDLSIDDEIDTFKNLYVSTSRPRENLFVMASGSIDGTLPEILSFFPDPTLEYADYQDDKGSNLDPEKLFEAVDWSDSAYERQKELLRESKLVSALKKLNESDIYDFFISMAHSTFQSQGILRYIEQNKNIPEEDVLRLVVEIGPKNIEKELKKREII